MASRENNENEESITSSMHRAQGIANERWRRWSFFKGRMPLNKKVVISDYAVVSTTSANQPQQFFAVLKKDITVSTSIKLSHPTNICLRLCECKNAQCTKVHCYLRREDPSVLVPLTVAPEEGSAILVHERGYLPFRIATSQTPVTAGLLFTTFLLEKKLLPSCHAFTCLKYRSGNCPAGLRCMYIHVNGSQLPAAQISPIVLSSTTVEEALSPASFEMQQFVDGTLHRMGIYTVGDVQTISPTMFDSISASDEQNSAYWMLLWHLRDIPQTNSLALSALQFPGVTEEMAAAIPPSLPDVGTLTRLKNKVFYSLGLPIPLLGALEKIRLRYHHATVPPTYTTISLEDEDQFPWFSMMAKTVCGFRKTHAHKSWRKQDAARPIVTSAITWVDPVQCQCKATKQHYVPPSPSLLARTQSTVMQRSSSVGSQSAERPTSSSPPNSPHKRTSTGDVEPSFQVPTADHWCQCKRSFEICVNYELSTPSGSRCSEQNALGKIASMGLPTSCIREVFVHGGSHRGDDPNPLFPCGVCENMLRRLSKDVMKEHGADIMLYMFNCEENPKKLVCLPVTEMSHRDGSTWKRFLEEDVYEDGGRTEGETE